MIKVKAGDEVAFNTLSDATWFTVLEILDGGRIVIREIAKINLAKQYTFASLVKQRRKGG